MTTYTDNGDGTLRADVDKEELVQEYRQLRAEYRNLVQYAQEVKARRDALRAALVAYDPDSDE